MIVAEWLINIIELKILTMLIITKLIIGRAAAGAVTFYLSAGQRLAVRLVNLLKL